MAALSGVKGNISLATGTGQTSSLLVTRWTSSADREIHDISNFDSPTNERDKLAGMLHLIGTVEGVVDSGAMILLTQMQDEDLTDTATFRLISRRGTSTSAQYNFDGHVSNTSLDVPKGGVQRWSMTFESTGAISIIEFADE